MLRTRARPTLVAMTLATLGLGACSPSMRVVPQDAQPMDSTAALDADAAPPPDGPVEEGACRSDSECDNGQYCDGNERCLAGRCQPGTPPCDDGRSCTRDACDEKSRACTHAPDDSMCSDGNACNGIERCDPAAPGSVSATGCTRPGETLIDCDDSNNCTVDSCDPRAGCVHAPRDLDGDGHVDRMCTVDGTPTGMQGDDCNDGDANVYPGAPEMCADNRDNNCDGRVDFADTTVCRPTNDTCATAILLPGPGTYWGSTVGLANDYALSCNAGSYADAVFEFTLTAPQDVTISTSTTDGTAAVALIDGCAPLSELRCARASTGFPPAAPSLRVRSLPAGTYRIVAETGSTTSAFRLTLRYDPPTPPPPDYTLGPSPAGVAFVDVCGMAGAGRMLASRDDATEAIPTSAVPFPLRVYGRDITPPTIAVSSNGWLSFSTTTSACYSCRIGEPTEPNMVLAPLWTDLYTRSGGVCYGTVGTAPNRKFIVQWNDLHECCSDLSTVHFTFEVVINEAPAGTNNTFDVIYQRMEGLSRSPTAGIENEDATLFTPIYPPFTAPRLLRLTPTR